MLELLKDKKLLVDVLYVERIGTSIQQDLRKGFISWRAYMC